MSKPTSTTPELKFWSEEPSRYNNPAGNPFAEKLTRPQIKLDQASDYSADVIASILPLIITRRHPKTLEFIDYRRWVGEDGDIRRLRGIILRNKHDDVLLYAYGFGLDDGHTNLVPRMFEMLDISKDDLERVKRSVWPKIDYSVVITLP